MKLPFIKPDFNNNIINITATIAEFLGCPNDKPVLPELAKELKEGYKNIVFIILDGLGINPIEKNLTAGSFLKRNIKSVVTSVFPSTTTNATTTYLTNKYPMEHGWFGWSLYFEELKRAVDIFPETDSFTREPIEKGYVKKVLPVEPFYKNANSDYTINSVVPEYWNHECQHRYVWKNSDEMFGHIAGICQNEGRQFIYAYCDQPDSTMHRFGVTSAEAKNVINDLNNRIEELYSKLTDTLFIVTADHGQVDIDGYIDIYTDTEITSLLEWPQFLEARAAAFKVKESCHKEFIEIFNKKYGKDFELFKTEDLINDNYFGGNIINVNAKLLGDYIAIGKTNKVMRLTPFSHDYKGHHTSLTEEMEVPLIFIGKKN